MFPYSEEVIRQLSQTQNLGIISSVNSGRSVETLLDRIEGSSIVKHIDSYEVFEEKRLDKGDYLTCIYDMEPDGSLKPEPRNIAIVDRVVDRGIRMGYELGCRTYLVKGGQNHVQVSDNEKRWDPTRIDTVRDLLEDDSINPMKVDSRLINSLSENSLVVSLGV